MVTLTRRCTDSSARSLVYSFAPMTRHLLRTALSAIAFLIAAACTTIHPMQSATEQPVETTTAPTVGEAIRFVSDAEARLAAINKDQQRAAWVAATFITFDTQQISAKESERQIAAGVELAKQAARFDKLELSYDVRRK